MVQTSENNKRIAKNTLVLYLRMFFTMLVSLYTSRIVLATLGEEDFGIYNVVGGVVAMFSFINMAMSASTQRYLTFELGKGNFENLRKVFCTSIHIHALISLIIVILAETIGLWFLYNKMTIPEARMDAAFWVYQLSVLSSVVMIMSVPYNASIVANEKMSAFAYISILEVLSRLVIVYLLLIWDFDKLKFYALLVFLVQVGIRIVYGAYCKRHFPETQYRWIWDGRLFKEMLGFASWNLWGNCAAVAFTQGLNLLLNMFFGPIVNAARAIAVQVQNAVNMFAANFQTAVNPQITKSYATQDYEYMHTLIFKSSKFTFFLLWMLCLPIMLEANNILELWLKKVPDYTAVFLCLILCVTMIDGMANSLMVAASSTGRVKLYQGVVGGILLCILPISYLVLKLGGNPPSVFVVHLCVCILAFIVRLLIIRPMIHLSLSHYFKSVLLPCMLVVAVSLLLPIGIRLALPENFWSFLLVCIASVLSVFLTTYFCGLSITERQFVGNKLQVMRKRIRGGKN